MNFAKFCIKLELVWQMTMEGLVLSSKQVAHCSFTLSKQLRLVFI